MPTNGRLHPVRNAGRTQPSLSTTTGQIWSSRRKPETDSAWASRLAVGPGSGARRILRSVWASPAKPSRFERGATQPSLLSLQRIAQVLKAPVADLLAEASPTPDDQAVVIATWVVGLA